MIHSIYYIAFLKLHTNTINQSTDTRALNLVSVLETIHKLYTNHTLNQVLKWTLLKKAYKISMDNYLNVVNRVQIVFNIICIMLIKGFQRHNTCNTL